MLIQLLSAFFGSLGFAALFNVRGQKLLPAAFGGLISWGVYLSALRIIPSDVVCYFIASILMTVYAETLARIFKTPATLFTISAAIPLIPGGSLYKTMSFAVRGDWASFSSQGIQTLLLAASISVGILITMGLWHVIHTVIKLLRRSGREKPRT